MGAALEQRLAIISGQSPQTFALKQVSSIDKQQINDALETLFSGLTLYNWLGGGGLGDAWQKSLDQIRNFVFEIVNVNPAVIYLRTAMVIHRDKWTNTRLTSHNCGDMVNCPADNFSEWSARANAQIDQGIAVLRNKIAQFDSVTPRAPIAESEIQIQKNHEREHDRERTR